MKAKFQEFDVALNRYAKKHREGGGLGGAERVN